MTRFLSRKLAIILLSLLFTNSCRETIKLPAIEHNVSTPVDMATDFSGEYFYVLNADFLHTYATGSLLVLNQDGDKVGSVPVPRLGKVLTVSGNDLFILFDHEAGEHPRKVLLFDISQPNKPVQKKEWHFDDCTPGNLASRKDYPYFALICNEGALWMGTLTEDRTKSTLKKVRTYPQIQGATRRALYLDPKRELLFAFITDVGSGTLVDSLYTDSQTWANGAYINNSPDEIPDALQQTAARASDVLDNTTRFEFMLYDIAKEASNGFPPKNFVDVRKQEPRWLYFGVENWDGTPDDPGAQGNSSIKYYRTNFWETRPDPDDSDSFYISHRGLGTQGNSEHANDIIKVTFKKGGDPRPNAAGVPPVLTSYLTFERVYGFKSDETGPDKYFNSFIITKYQGQKVILLNSFRDLVNFSNPRYMIAAANVIEKDSPFGAWFTDVSSWDVDNSYYQLALAKNGNLLTSSFYTDDLRLFKVNFGDTISLIKPID